MSYVELAKTLIKRHEGLSLTMYKDTVGKNTIGYGHNLDDKPITEQTADVMLEEDMVSFVVKAQKYPWFSKLTDTRKAVIVDMVFNMGSVDEWHNFQDCLDKNDYAGAAAAMLASKWATQVHGRAIELSKLMAQG